MKIKEISVRNFRSISHDPGVEIQLGTLTALAGANDSGKTAFLLASYLGLMGLFGFPKGRDILYHRYIGEQNKHDILNNAVENTKPTLVCIKLLLHLTDIERYLIKSESWNIRGQYIPYAKVLETFSEIECFFDVNVDTLFNANGQVNKDFIGLKRWFNHEKTFKNNFNQIISGLSGSNQVDEAFASDFLTYFLNNMQWQNINGQVFYRLFATYHDFLNRFKKSGQGLLSIRLTGSA